MKHLRASRLSIGKNTGTKLFIFACCGCHLIIILMPPIAVGDDNGLPGANNRNGAMGSDDNVDGNSATGDNVSDVDGDGATVIGHGIGGKDIPIMGHLAKARH